MGFGQRQQHIEKLHAIRMNAAILGLPLPIAFGQNRLTGKLIWYGDFTAKKSKQQGGSGLGKGGSQYVYSASVIAALANVSVTALASVWDSMGSKYVVESATESYTVATPFTYTPVMANAFNFDQGVAVPTAYSHATNDYGSPGPVTLTGTTNVLFSVASGTLIASDAFSGSILGPNWTVNDGAFIETSGTCQVSAVGGGTRACAWWNANTFSPDQTAQCTIATSLGSGGAFGPAVRMASSGETYYAFYVTSSGSWFLFKCIAGSVTNLVTGSHSPLVGDVLLLSIVGTTLVAKINGTQVGTTTDSALASGQPGMAASRVFGGTPGSNDIDNWSATSGAAPGTGQYVVNPVTGVYSFAAADNGKSVQITYGFYRYILSTEELSIVPFSGPFNVTVQNAAVFKKDLGVVYDPSGDRFVSVSGAPAAVGQYHYAGSGVYNFYSGDAGQGIVINYEFADPNTDNNAPQHLNLTLLNGAKNQVPWSFLTSKHPSQALGYSSIASIASSQLYLGFTPELPNYNFEVALPFQFGGGILDADPADCITAILSDATFGIGFPLANIGDLTLASKCFVANSFFISPLLENQQSVASVIGEWLEAGMVAAFWSEGLLKFVPYSDSSAVGNGIFYQPLTNPVANFTDDDYITQDQAENPIRVSRTPWMDAYNRVHVAFQNRVNDYNPESIYEQDEGSVQRLGVVRQEDSKTWDFIHTLVAAQYAASMRLQRYVYIRNTYEFKLASSFAYLEPMDVVTVTDSILGFAARPVRIQKIEDDPVAGLQVLAEDFIWGAAAPAIDPTKETNTPAPPLPGNEDPYNTEAIIFEATSRFNLQQGNILYGFVNGTNENWGGTHVWVSFDGVNYKLLTTVNSPARIGNLVANLPAYGGAEPDVTNILAVAMNDATPLSSTTPGGAQNGVTECAIVSTQQQNFAPNGDFEQSAGIPPPYWIADGAGTTLSYDTSTPHSGVRSLVMTTSHQYGAALGPVFPGVAGATYYVQGWIKSAAGKFGDIQLMFLDSGMSYLGGLQPNSTSSSWTFVSASGVAPAGTAFVRMSLQVNDVGGGVIEFDDIVSYMSSAANPTVPFNGLEFLSYVTATLVSENEYNLTTLYRGQDNTGVSAHSTGDLFVRLDEASFEEQFDPTFVGKSIWYKFTSFNLLGQNEQNIADVEAFEFVIGGTAGAIALDTGYLNVVAPGYAAYRPTTNPLTAHDAGANATINIASFAMLLIGNPNINYSSGSITGLAYNTRFWVYLDDPNLAGGSPSGGYHATTIKETAFAGLTRFFIGSIVTPTAGAPDTTGNNDGGAGAQNGSNLYLGFANGSSASFNNPTNAFDGSRVNFSDWSTHPAQLVGDCSVGLIVTNLTSLAVFVDFEIDTFAAGAAVSIVIGTPATPNLYYSNNWVATLARTTISVTIPIGSNLSTLEVQVAAGSGGASTGKVYGVWAVANT